MTGVLGHAIKFPSAKFNLTRTMYTKAENSFNKLNFFYNNGLDQCYIYFITVFKLNTHALR